MSQRNMPGRYPISGSQIKQLTALRSEFDFMEESLREALRHENRQRYAKCATGNTSPLCENTITKRRNYITVYEHEPVYDAKDSRNRATPENQQRVVQAHSSGQVANVTSARGQTRSAPAEEFQRYCVLLVNRIRKMEEQNVELMKMAEHQQHEYQKVVAQVVESEKSQRLLLSECNSLREQVQQLANHNKKLKEQHLLKIKSPKVSTQGYRSNADSNTNNSFAGDHNKALEQLHGHTVSLLERCKTADVASIVELYAALQKATLADFENATDERGNQSPQSRPIIKSTHDDSELAQKAQKKTNFAYEDPDYASPSNICTAPSCTRCLVRSNSDSLALPNQPFYLHNHGAETESFEDQRGTLNSQGTCHSVQSFDNNAYIEVELKPGKQFQVSQQNFPSSQEPRALQSFDRSKKLRDSRNNYENAVIQPNLYDHLENSSMLNTNPVFSASHSNKSFHDLKESSSVLGSENLAVSKSTSSNENKGISTQEPKHNKKSKPATVQPQILKQDRHRNSSKTSSPIPGIDNIQRGYIGNSSKKKKYSRSASTSDLPPPPPPPPKTVELEKEEKHLPTRSLSPSGLYQITKRSPDNAAFLHNLKPIRESNDEKPEENKSKKHEEFSTTLEVWKNRENSQADLFLDKNQTRHESTAGGRRGSYSRACRKSQSFDHIYEILLDDEENSNTGDPALSELSNGQNPANAQCKAGEMKSNDRRNPPTFVIQESSSALYPYEIMMPVEQLKDKNDLNCEESKKTGSPLVMSAPKSCIEEKEIACQSPTSNRLTTSEELDEVFSPALPSNPDDVVFTSTQEHGRNRRFSEGSTANRQKDRLFRDGERKNLLRNQSVDVNNSSTKPKEDINSRLHLAQSSKQIPNKSYLVYGNQISNRKTIQQPKFPITNPHIKTGILSSNEILNKNDDQAKKTKPKLSAAAMLTRQNSTHHVTSAQNNPANSFKNEAFVQTSNPNPSRSFSPKQFNREGNDKRNVRKKESNFSNVDIKKKSSSGNGQSKSFVNLMKAKFTRSSVRVQATEKQESKALSAFPVTPASALIDPRTLSLEPNAFPPSGKNEKKLSKQTLGENSDAAVGRKLSQPFPNGYGENLRSQTQFVKVLEKSLLDKDDADVSSTDQSIVSKKNNNLKNSKLRNDKTAMSPILESKSTPENETSWKKQNLQSQNLRSYENMFHKPPKNIIENSSEMNRVTTSDSVSHHRPKPKNSRRNKSQNEHFYENVPLGDSRSTPNETFEKTDETKPCPPFGMPPTSNLTSQENSTSNLERSPAVQQSTVYLALQKKNSKANHHIPPSIETQRNDVETAFIKSHVEAELKLHQPRVKGKIALTSNAKEGELKSLDLSRSSSSSNIASETSESFGTLSSLGSLPSDAIENDDVNKASLLFFEESLNENAETNKKENLIADTKKKLSSTAFKNETGLLPKTQSPSTKVRFSPTIEVTKSKRNCLTDEAKSKKVDNDSSEESILKVMKAPTKKSRIIYRPSKIATSSKLAQPVKITGSYASDKKGQQGLPSNKNIADSKTKFSPSVNSSSASHSRAQLNQKSPSSKPVNENLCIFEKQKNLRRLNI